MDGATGAVRARVPITTSDYFHGLLDDGSTDCDAALDTFEGIGLSDQWALTTADAYGVVIFDREEIHFDCGARDTGHLLAAQHLLSVDRDGASTTTLLSQRTETYPATQAALAMPEATALAPDARGNFVVTFENEERQLLGADPSGPILPIGDGVIVSADGLHVAGDQTTIRATDLASGQLLWTVTHQGVPLALAAHSRSAAVVRTGSTVLEVGPEGSLPVLELPSSLLEESIRYRLDGLVQGASAELFATIQAVSATGALLAGSQRNDQAQGTQRRQCLWTRSKYKSIETPVAFVTPSPSAAIEGWEAGWFNDAVDEWNRELAKHRLNFTLRVTTAVPSGSGELVIPVAFQAPTEGDHDLGRVYFSHSSTPTRMEFYYSNWRSQASDPRPDYYRRHVAYIYRHEIGHVLGLDHVLDYTTASIMGTLLDIRYPEPGPDKDRLTCGEQNAMREIYRVR